MGLLRPKRSLRTSDGEQQQATMSTRDSEVANRERNQQSEQSVLPLIKIDKDTVLGEGRYGIVYKGTLRGKQAAIKRIQLTHINENEEKALKKLNHPNVIQLLHIESDDEFRYFALELCQASLDKLFLKDNETNKYRGPMPNEIDVFLQLAKGLECIHTNGLIHRDLKPQNVLIWENPENGQVVMKLADFGLSKPVTKNGTCSMSGPNKGTDNWYAREILEIQLEEEKNGNRTTPPSQRANVKSDVYSAALVFGYYLLSGRHPFGLSIHIPINILANNPVTLNAEITERQPIHEIIIEMLNSDPVKRISSSDVVSKIEHLVPT